MEDHRLPQAEGLELLADVEVRRTVGVSRVQGIVRVLIVRAGTIRIHALGPLELHVGLEVVRTRMLHLDEHGVVVRHAFVDPEVSAAVGHERIERPTGNDRGGIRCHWLMR